MTKNVNECVCMCVYMCDYVPNKVITSSYGNISVIFTLSPDQLSFGLKVVDDGHVPVLI